MEKISIIFTALLLFSCGKVSRGLEVTTANYDFEKGVYSRANYKYLKVLEKGDSNYVLYNLGNVYFSLGESAAALRMWGKVADADSSELQFRLDFNKGLMYFDDGEYMNAFNSFKSALLIKPDCKDTKKNLELALQKIDAIDNSVDRSSSSRGNPLDSGLYSNLLNYAKRQEIRTWNQLEKSEDEVSKDW
jgi:Ca-activated chloride channel family protein